MTPPRSPLTPSPGFSLIPTTPCLEGAPPLLLHHSSPCIPIPGSPASSAAALVSCGSPRLTAAGTSASVHFEVATNGGESYRHVDDPTSMSPGDEEEGGDEAVEPGGSGDGDMGDPPAAGLGVLLPSFGLTPPEEEGLKTTDGILKVGFAFVSYCIYL